MWYFKRVKEDLFYIAAALFCAYIVFPIFFEAMIYPLPSNAPLWASLDPSWLLQLNYANIKHYTWGVDIAYTYGPLSYLSTKVGWGQSSWTFILYDLLITVNFFFLFFFTLRDSKNKIVTTLLIIAFLTVYPVWLGAVNALILMGLLVFWIRKSLDEPRIWNYAFQIAIVVLAFFIKFNTGLIAFPLFFSGIVYNVITFWKNKKIVFKLCIVSTIPFVLISALSYPLHVAILPYIQSGMEMVAGYNEIMYIDHSFKIRKLALCIIILTSFVLFYKTYKDGKIAFFKNLTIIFLFGVSIFILYKQGFVRGMEIDFFIFTVLLILAVTDFHFTKNNWIASIFVLAAVGISVYFVFIIQQVPANFGQKLDKLYFAQLKNFSTESGLHLIPNNNQISQSVKQRIGNNSVDVYPWNLQMLWENGLNAAPRPAFQSYSTYTHYLEDMNFAHYNDREKAPKFVIYDYASVDGRYPFFDEPKLNVQLLLNYEVVEVFDFENRKVALLKKKKNFRPVVFEQSDEYAIPIGGSISPRADTFYEIFPYTNLIGKGKAIIDHAPEINLVITDTENKEHYFKTSSKLLESGLFSERYIETTPEFVSLVKGSAMVGKKVKYYSFKPLNKSLFKEKIRVREFKIRH